MVRQKKWTEMNEELRAQAKAMVARFEHDLRGIVKMKDPFGVRRKLYTHQVVAVQRFTLKNHQVPWRERKSSLLAVHDLGLGKTITAILAIARVHDECPDPVGNKTMVIVPLAVLTAWHDALQSWTTLGNRVLMGHKQLDLTKDAIANAKVIVTTPDVLKAAFKSFVYMGTSPEDRKKPKMQRFHHGVAPSNSARLAQLQGALPPVHPIFELLTQQAPALALTVVDEIQKCSNPTTLSGHVVAMFCTDSVYTLGLSATPVSNDPSQLAHLAKTLNAQPQWLQHAQYLFVKGNKHRIKEEAVKQYHDLLVDRVTSSFLDLPPKQVVLLEYDPWVGRGADGQTDQEAIEAHNSMLAAAKKMVAGNAMEAREMAQGKFGERERAVIAATVALGHYEFSSVLGVHGAAAFDKNKALFAEAAARGSECMRLILRMLRSRQGAGHPRICVFSESVTQLRILELYLQPTDVGALYLYEGHLSGIERGRIVHDFLRCDRGVLLLSTAGAIGTTICPGCEVMFSVGNLPWDSTTVDQAFGRVHRIGQTLPVEIVQFAARRSVTAAKLALHDDKRERLERALRDEDFSAFGLDSDLWRRQMQILGSCTMLTTAGNYMSTTRQLAELRAWERRMEALDARGMPHPPTPMGLLQRPRLAAAVPLPPVAFPRPTEKPPESTS